MNHKTKLKGSMYIDLIIGMALSVSIALAVFSYSAMSAKIMGAEISSLNTRAKIYDLTRSFTGDVTSAKSVQISGDGLTLEIFSDINSEHQTAVYEYIDGYLYFTAKNYSAPMRVLKAGQAAFQYDDGVVTLTAVPNERSSFQIEVSAYLRAE